jgi:hypothetical protein
LAYRERSERWQLWYRRKRPGRAWEAPQSLAISPTQGYNHYMQSLVVGPDNTLHLCFQFHYAASGRAIDCTGRAAVYLRSEDGGDTWFNEDKRCDTLPLTMSTMIPICRYPAGGVRVGNHIVDGQNRPWLFTSLPDVAGGVLWQRTDAGWEGQDLSAAFTGLSLEGGRATSLSRDAEGQLHLVVATSPGGETTRWFDPRLELFHLLFSKTGQVMSLAQVTQDDPACAGWLPALEQTDWTRRTSCVDGCWLAYTRGLNAGGIGGDNRNAVMTSVFLSKV